jgi:hypothetical protein
MVILCWDSRVDRQTVFGAVGSWAAMSRRSCRSFKPPCEDGQDKPDQHRFASAIAHKEGELIVLDPAYEPLPLTLTDRRRRRLRLRFDVGPVKCGKNADGELAPREGDRR